MTLVYVVFVRDFEGHKTIDSIHETEESAKTREGELDAQKEYCFVSDYELVRG